MPRFAARTFERNIYGGYNKRKNDCTRKITFDRSAISTFVTMCIAQGLQIYFPLNVKAISRIKHVRNDINCNFIPRHKQKPVVNIAMNVVFHSTSFHRPIIIFTADPLISIHHPKTQTNDQRNFNCHLNSQAH